MKIVPISLLLFGVCVFAGSVRCAEEPSARPGLEAKELAGSISCRDCHEEFYKLWSTSHHGLAMQPFTTEFALKKIAASTSDIEIGEFAYRAVIENGSGWLKERGPDGDKSYPLVHVLGGKNVYYFLTPLERGRLQTLPLGYDINTKKWFDTAGSGVRHFPDREEDAPLHWTDREYTFNTSCYGCHVSQMAKNYDLETDTYHTVWAEPGINCETCHGPSEEHVRLAWETPPGEKPKDLGLIVTSDFTSDQTNTMCAPCHAKMTPITTDFQPGERYFDHYDLVTLEHQDYYPDGRDLGENYTYTSWRMSPCVKSGQLDCLHCHTSSGRYRHVDDPDQSCLPCHKERVENVAEHSRHPAESEGSRCIACHMPNTGFARMRRSDHSMLPPTPATTIEFESPNACNLCHADQDAAWSDKFVREWAAEETDYQAPILDRARLLDGARKRDWSRLPDMLAYIAREDRDEIFATSLIRTLGTCDDESKWPALLAALEDPSPLVRASAAEGLRGHVAPEAVKRLVESTRDDSRLVRIRAAATLAGLPPETQNETDRKGLEAAVEEFKKAMRARPDDSSSHYNLGNFYVDRRDFENAVTSFETASKLHPSFIFPLINVSLAYNALGKNDEAEKSLRKAIAIEPKSEAANLNLALLMGEEGRLVEAEKAFRAVLESETRSAVAAYNLGVLLAPKNAAESLFWCRVAKEAEPEQPKYAYTYAFFVYQTGDVEEAVRTLEAIVDAKLAYPEAYLLLGEIHAERGNRKEALAVYGKGAANESLSEAARREFQRRIGPVGPRR